MPRLRALACGATFASTLVLGASAARASETLLPPTYAKQSITIDKGDVWNVDEGGTTVIVTETLTVDGLLTAVGLGSKGTVTKGAGMGGGNGGMDMTMPGGGAGFIGKGGGGNTIALMVCTAAVGAEGGAAFVDPMGDLAKLLGSAGGGSGGDKGGAGGGHIIIKATTVVVNGAIDASGLPIVHVDGYAGGGSGGVIEIHAYELKGTGTIVAKGADGVGKASATIAGGGGAGGLVLLDLVKKSGIAPDVSAGVSTGCMGVGDGEPGLVVETKPKAGCIDADGDGFYPKVCSPAGKKADCDDSDPDIHPGAEEVCDGLDNDCNQTIDDVAPGACGAGKVCVDGGCQTSHEMDAGEVDGGAAPDHLDFEGGCDISPIATASGFAAGIGALTSLALVFRLRRRRDRRPRR